MRQDWFDYGAEPSADFPPPSSIIVASYGGGSYEGDAFVLFRKDGKLYEATGSHCSCFGLEGQWSPEETTVRALKMRDFDNAYGFLYDHDDRKMVVDIIKRMRSKD